MKARARNNAVRHMVDVSAPSVSFVLKSAVAVSAAALAASGFAALSLDWIATDWGQGVVAVGGAILGTLLSLRR